MSSQSTPAHPGSTVGEPAPVELFNSMNRTAQRLQPIEKGRVSLYCCGPTVYNFQHIGNLRTYIFEDILVRTLRYAGYEVQHVMNVTDVGHLVSDADDGEDKMLVAAKREGKKSGDVAAYYTEIFFEHCRWLNISRPTIVCKATEHIEQMIALIARLEAAGAAYVAGGNVYFDVSKDEDYGKLAGLNLEALKAGARIEVDSNKRNPLDFALWFTKSKFENQELQWESPWGRGYPGWHIECSAMAMHYLGESFDIHCGGIDHIPVHHTNEIAQSETATGKPFSKIWMHGGFLVVNKDKMSKSTGEFLTLDVVKERGFDPLSYRLLCFSGSYRSELSWSWEALQSAANSLARLKSGTINLYQSSGGAATPLKSLSPAASAIRDKFRAELFSDLGMPKALAVVYQTLGESSLSAADRLALLYDFDAVLGLGISEWRPVTEDIPEEIAQLARERDDARSRKDWKRSDELRAVLTEKGWTVEDSRDGTKLRRS